MPSVAIVGRPNVGKSTLFNRLVGKRLALVDDRPGVTRDRREGDADLIGLRFLAIDTAGFEDEDPASLPGRMRFQTEAAVKDCDVALFVIDARQGVTPLDEEIARWLRALSKPVLVVANKCEGRGGESGFLEAYSLGFGEPLPFSAEHGEGLVGLFQALLPFVEGETSEKVALDDEKDETEKTEEEIDQTPLQLAIVGRPNAGKSTLINRLIGEDRMITGPEAGITRDSIAIDWEWQGRPVRLIDTAGLRKKARVVDKMERLSVMDTFRTIDYAEVVVLLLDATQGLEGQDLRIADRVLEEGRSLIIAINKWDMVENPSAFLQAIRQGLDDGLAQVKGVPLITISAITGRGIDPLLKAAFETRKAWSRRVSTGQLNRWLTRAITHHAPPAPGGKRIKLRYLTQIKTRPPTFVLFGTRVDQLPTSYERYLVNSLRSDLGFGAVPIRLHFRSPDNPFD
ncbi:MAG: ribosome biogenesis GTPase Der [Zymomonas mobilis subsp. pomaceae]|uniref:GTPase Der n=1 Tax=Zymomonas mobilis subsp. pomaceae (strain ATCC 29192 / DSM 22645 / JCM 10191 / CCUG 17912 / NBRC 13757 / NCIMB 11200 / NRRL B-4491 / Barker I) TaxID=579138 RepID=F8ES86_ZYMMT|nr:ribosome biogenesis GTPase Der [Zymomonas mobilis]AEI37661.1 ribosome-associated GTPase EngA [Zymomonas mobilis subsp. pomaceae ATCC 29192]MDX5949029.1 ribosome biogenesis GTPase Der [Zymomonas mobilis subsp. pomaceae]GEB88834.1 GTPase Der [Zymomonas mobilis subsp. pomaceae]